MGWSVTRWTVTVAITLAVFLFLQFVYLAVVLSWEHQKTQGLGYYGQSAAERLAFKRTLAKHAFFLAPVLWLLPRLTSFAFDKATFAHEGVPGPKGTCSEESFAKGAQYAALAEDIFVVTQMKCGTTWMQHVVYETLNRGRGDLVASGGTLYALCPWLEATKSVGVDEAPLLGTERPSRVIKTHFPVSLCPWSEQARYIYVARHPVSCFASCVDFVATNAGPLAPKLGLVEAWFCSDAMWWTPWTEHVAGWWKRSREESNVLFVYFEDMKGDLGAVVDQVAAFLGVAPLSDGERAEVVRKCGFGYMQEYKDAFEMHPPHLLATEARLFVRGSVDRHRDVPPEVGARVAAWCAAALDGSAFPLATAYPDVADP